MKNLKILVVGGSFNESGGKPSKLVEKMFSSIDNLKLINGGHYDKLYDIIQSVVDYEVVIWMANVTNDYPKIRNVKSINPRCLLVTTKRNDEGKYSMEELVNRALEQKANLTIEISLKGNIFQMRLFDPLANVWCDYTTDYARLMQCLFDRLGELSQFTRQRSTMWPQELHLEVPEKFIEIVREKAEIFHKLIEPPEVVHRFLGNCSFRCVDGFPSARVGGYIMVSRRNVDKEGISAGDFVPVILTDKGGLHVYGSHKPSVDTPIQVRLYRMFPEFNYMLHSHCYLRNAVFTEKPVPCGALEEVYQVSNAVEILKRSPYYQNQFDREGGISINLKGHGSLVMASRLEYFDIVEYIKRPMPEIQQSLD